MLLSLLIIPLLFTTISMMPPQLSDDSGSAAEMLDWCASFENATGVPYTIKNVQKQSLCLGYMRGVLDTAVFAGMVCPPKGDRVMIQVVKVVLKYINNHPEWLHIAAVAPTLPALREAFPCK